MKTLARFYLRKLADRFAIMWPAAFIIASQHGPGALNDAETFVWWIVPLIAAVAGAVYEARRHHLRDQDHENRISNLERVEAYNNGVKDERSSTETPDLVGIAAQVAINTQAIGGMEERLTRLESKKR